MLCAEHGAVDWGWKQVPDLVMEMNMQCVPAESYKKAGKQEVEANKGRGKTELFEQN